MSGGLTFSTLTAGSLVRLNTSTKALESTTLVAADLPSTVVHTDASSTLLTGELTVCSATGGASANTDFVSLTAHGYLFLNRQDGASGVFFQSNGVNISHSIVSGNARLSANNADFTISANKKYQINGSDLSFSDMAGSVAVSQLPSVALTTATTMQTSDHIKFTGTGYHYIKGPTTNKIRVSDTQVGILNSQGSTVMSYDSTYNNYTIADTQLYVASSAYSEGTIMHIDAVSSTPSIQFFRDVGLASAHDLVRGGIRCFDTIAALSAQIADMVTTSSDQTISGKKLFTSSDGVRIVVGHNETCLRFGTGDAPGPSGGAANPGYHDTILWSCDGNSNAHDGLTTEYGFLLKYVGSGNGRNNRLQLIADNSTNTPQKIVYDVYQDGEIRFHNTRLRNRDKFPWLT